MVKYFILLHILDTAVSGNYYWGGSWHRNRYNYYDRRNRRRSYWRRNYWNSDYDSDDYW